MLAAIEHDAERWGVSYSDEAHPRELTRLADLAKQRTNSQTGVRDAGAAVLGALMKSAPAEWFVLQPGGRARSLLETDLWCDPPDPLLRNNGDDWRLVRGESPWAQFDASLDRLGRAGLMECLIDSWCRATCAADLDEGIAARIAILRIDAQRLFGDLLHDDAVDASLAGHNEAPAIGDRKLPPDAEVLEEHQRDGTAAVAARYGVHRTAVQRAVQRAKAVRPTSSVFALATAVKTKRPHAGQ
jgi:hypothetical protein